MDRRILLFIAIVVSMFYGVGFSVVHHSKGAYAAVGAVVCAACWVAVGMLGRRDTHSHNSADPRDPRDHTR